MKKCKRGISEDFTLQVKTELLRRDMTVAALARKLGKSRTAISLAVNHPSMFPALKLKIRSALHLAA